MPRNRRISASTCGWGTSARPNSASLLRPEIQSELDGTDPLAPVHSYNASCKARNPLNRVLYLDMKLYMESDILVKSDRASMANSLEVRVPLLNRVLVDYATALPIEMKLHGFTRKYIFREAMRGKLPKEIIEREKHGFGMPISKWLRGDLRELAQDLFSKERIQRDGLFEYEYVNNLLNNHLAGTRDNRKPLWTLLVFQQWYDKYMTGQPSTSETSRRARSSLAV